MIDEIPSPGYKSGDQSSPGIHIGDLGSGGITGDIPGSGLTGDKLTGCHDVDIPQGGIRFGQIGNPGQH